MDVFIDGPRFAGKVSIQCLCNFFRKLLQRSSVGGDFGIQTVGCKFAAVVLDDFEKYLCVSVV